MSRRLVLSGVELPASVAPGEAVFVHSLPADHACFAYNGCTAEVIAQQEGDEWQVRVVVNHSVVVLPQANLRVAPKVGDSVVGAALYSRPTTEAAVPMQRAMTAFLTAVMDDLEMTADQVLKAFDELGAKGGGTMVEQTIQRYVRTYKGTVTSAF